MVTPQGDEDHAWLDVKRRWPPGTRVRGRATHHVPFGAFLDLGVAGIQGLIRVTDLIPELRPLAPEDFPPIGAEVEATVVGFNDHNHQVLLSLIQRDTG